ncbi:MAG TPA: hemerythrin domain-containing protein [Acidovorax sp.]|nr:hemerythrin domain-containing protein [Acidovorax sp.]
MAQLEWSEALNLDLPLMDDTHREFVDLLAAVDQADDAGLLPRWRALVEHTEQHFGQEDDWMASTRFASGNCHSMQHRVVLQVMREGTARAEQGDLQVLRVMAGELALWFPQHAQAMDASLALHLRRVGFDPATGVVHAPGALPQALIHGCGGASCSDTDAPGAEEPAAHPHAAPTATALPA